MALISRSSRARFASGAGVASAAVLSAIVISSPAFAQAGASETNGEIIVTARKREETQIEVPVTITAVGKEQLDNYAITTIDSVARAVPSLIVGEGGGTIQGGIIAIRGLAGADNNPLNDQAVSFNIDGVSIGRATVRRMSELDLQQIEVLKGPQALFFGKNSPAGIISIRTADPTNVFEAKISAGYEFKAREWRTEGYVSAPLTETLGVRVAGSFSDMKGWARNVVPRDYPNAAAFGIYPSEHSRAPNKQDWAIRGTLKYDDGDRFDARFKIAYSKVKDETSSAGNTQFVSCPLGRPQNSIGLPAGIYIDDCKADNRNQIAGANGANLQKLYPDLDWGDGNLFLEQYQLLSSLEMNYRVADVITLTSVTGFYKQNLNNLGNFTQSYFNDGAIYNLDGAGNVVTAPNGAAIRRWDLPSYNQLSLREFSQELRLTTNFDGAINFMVGGLFTDTKAEAGATTVGKSSGYPTSVPLGAPFPNGVPVYGYYYGQTGTSWSVFGQATFNPIEQIEISAGARASWEKKKLPLIMGDYITRGTLSPINPPGLDRDISFDDISPEMTIAYKPNRDLNIYASYKEGFLSGGFSALQPTAGVIAGTQQVTYDQQVTKGFEAGIKAALFNRKLLINLAAYNYKTTGLQVGVTTEGTQQELRNAGSVRTKGIEADVTYRTPVEGFSLTSAFNYNKAYYISYVASCYRGQPSEQCFLQLNPVTGTNSLLQDLAGQDLVRAPRWTANAGFNYETPIGGAFKLGISGNMSYSDDYFTDTTNSPGGKQPSYTLFDASVRFSDADDRWELALIGKNLSNKYYFVRSSDTPFTGSNPGAYAANSPFRLLGDTAAYVSRGRELWVRMSYKFGGRN